MSDDEVIRQLLRLAKVVVRHWAKIEDAISEGGTRLALRPGNAKRFPDAKVGDILYSCEDLEEGVRKDAIVRLEDGGFVRTVPAEPDSTESFMSWGLDRQFASEAEALEAEARRDIDYHNPRLQRALRVLSAVQSGKDLAPFRQGIDPDDDAADGPEAEDVP